MLFPDVNSINKFHHIEHYVKCIKWMGPLKNNWCMRYEAKHGGIRQRAQNVHNFKNLPKTLIRLCQCEQSAKWSSKDVKISRLTTINKKIVAVENTLSSEALYALDYIGTDERYGTVKATLLNHSQGSGILKSTKNSWNEENRKALVRIMVAELIKCHSHYPPDESKQALAKAIVTEFPSLKDKARDLGYIDMEFKSLFPKSADNFLSKFPTSYTKKILIYAKNCRPALYYESESIKNDDFRALLLLVELLPVAYSVRTRKGQGKGMDKEKEKKGKGKKRLANEENEENEPLEINFPNKYLLRLSPEGTNLEQFARDIRAKSKKNVQPYLVTVASQSSSASTFINGDGWFLNVPDNVYEIFIISWTFTSMTWKPFNTVSSVHVNITNINTQSGDPESSDDLNSD
ncbi:hypothetical protein G9C98_007461 [Cotesia typhae]|uniref:Uncharacterized protein n=1 Tax=Cotesia typhae TaxID=2053667 RepID=A0A8J5QL51_9HYME|nr:hypothetical protein G9C98_007461 [Cotesia typhae]